MEIFIIVIVIIIAFAAGLKDADRKKNKERVAELLKQQDEKVKTKQDEKIAEKTAITGKDEDEETIPDDKMLITKSTFEEMCQQLKEAYDMIMDICREKDFQSYVLGIKTGNDNIDNSQKLFGSMKFFLIQDILRNYGRMGHRYYSSGGSRKKICSIEFDKSEGQLLYVIVMQMMKLDDNKQFTWEECKKDI